MKAPLSWLKEYVDIDCTAEELQAKLFSCGFEVEEMVYVAKHINRIVTCKIDKIENRKIKAVIKVIGFVVFSSYLVSLKENVAYLLIGIFSLVYLLYQFYLSGLETK